MNVSKRIKNISGKKFGRLSVIRFYGQDKHLNALFVCLCDCSIGEENRPEIILPSYRLVTGSTKSCGCLFLESIKKHGMSKSKEYIIWTGMKFRCYNKKCKEYHNYGGRGIKVCERWLESFQNFYEDMGRKPTVDGIKYSLDRIDCNGDYCKENCRWATCEQQNNNQRDILKIEYKGKFYSISQLARLLNINRTTLSNRIHSGWDIDRCINEPIHQEFSHKRQTPYND